MMNLTWRTYIKSPAALRHRALGASTGAWMFVGIAATGCFDSLDELDDNAAAAPLGRLEAPLRAKRKPGHHGGGSNEDECLMIGGTATSQRGAGPLRIDLDRPRRFEVPESMPVTRGNASTSWSELIFTEGTTSLTCEYRPERPAGFQGRGRGASPDGSRLFLHRCNDGGRAGETVLADELWLILHGEHTHAHRHDTVEARIVLKEVEPCGSVCDGVVVDDGNPCTLDRCDPIAGVTREPTPAGQSCADSDRCNGDETCDGRGSCVSGAAVVCGEPPQCWEFAGCDGATGECRYRPSPDGTSCADTDVCNGVETCTDGQCVAGMALDVDDGNACTVDSCDPLTGVHHDPQQLGSVRWVDWLSAEGQQANGEAGNVLVSYAGELSPEPIVDGTGLGYWGSNLSTYAHPPEVDNPPDRADILRITGGGSEVMGVSFSEPVVNPVMAILSLGQAGFDAEFHFDAEFRILNNGPGAFGNGPLAALPGNVLRGAEGHGLIQFQGQFSSLHWTAPIAEYWFGFTFAIPETCE